MTIADFVTMSRRAWRWLALFLILGIAAGGAYGLLAPKTYTSTTSGFLAMQGDKVFGAQSAGAPVSSYLSLIETKPVLDRIAAAANVSPASVSGHVSAALDPTGTLIQVTATSSDPQTAATLAGTALDALAAVVKEVNATAGAGDGAVTVIPMQNATIPTKPTSPSITKALLIGAVGGLALGYVFVLLRQALDTRVRTGRVFAQLTNATLMGSIPKLTGDDIEEVLLARAGEVLRKVRTALRFAGVDKPVRSIVVTSPNPSEGKSTIAAALARLIAMDGQPTILIDGDLRRPAVAKMFAVDGVVGLSDALVGQVPLRDAIRPSGYDRLSLLPAGTEPPNPSELLGSETLRTLVRSLSKDYFVVIDSPPLLPVTDGVLLAADADGVVMVAASGKTRKVDVNAACAQLGQAGVRLLGVVLNMVSPRDASDGHSYYQRYRGYYASPTEAAAQVARSVASPVAAVQSSASASKADVATRRRRSSRPHVA